MLVCDIYLLLITLLLTDLTKHYKINDFIALKLKNNKTVLYVGGEEFRQCKHLLLILPSKIEEKDFSVEDIEEYYDRSLEDENIHPLDMGLTPEQEFIGHCSNLQAWVENDFDSRILHPNLAFPLLRKLYFLGEKNVKEALKKEIIDRIENGNNKTLIFLLMEGFLDILGKFDLEMVFDTILNKLFLSNNAIVQENIIHYLDVLYKINKIIYKLKILEKIQKKNYVEAFYMLHINNNELIEEMIKIDGKEVLELPFKAFPEYKRNMLEKETLKSFFQDNRNKMRLKPAIQKAIEKRIISGILKDFLTDEGIYNHG